MARPISRLRKTVFSIIITSVMLAILFVILELGLGTYYSSEESANLMRFDAERGWALRPGDYRLKPIHRFTAFDLHVNELGLRSVKPSEDQQHRTQLVVLGDSFTFARESNTAEMFTQRLQDALDVRRADVEVINAGVPAYGTAQQMLLLDELIAEGIDPKFVLLVFFSNDILDNLCLSYGETSPQTIRPCFGVDEAGRPVLKSAPVGDARYVGDDTLARPQSQSGLGLRSVSVARNLAEGWLQSKPGLVGVLTRVGIEAQVARVPGLLNGWYREDTVARGVPLTAALIREIHRRVTARGGRFAVTMVPSPFQVYAETYVPLLRHSFDGHAIIESFASDITRPQRLVRKICAEAGIPFQDLLPAFSARAATSLFLPRDGHLNGAGHEVAAAQLLAFIDSQNWASIK
jgi:lysophospholipase L1-like esterase